MSNRPLDKCTLFECEKRKLPICCHSCDGYKKCNIKCMNTPDKCGSFEKVL